MSAYVIVATKNRAKETYVLLDYLAAQTLAPTRTYLVGSEPKDIEGLDRHPLVVAGQAKVLLARAGLTIQRNAGLDAMVADLPSDAASNPDWFVTFFDDDFRPAADWLQQASLAFSQQPGIAGITGALMADGIKTEFGISEEDTVRYLDGSKAPEPNWSNTGKSQVLDGLYGCNMAYRGISTVNARFDEHLPMYAWQEDADYSSRARQYGDMLLLPACRGVHIGSSSGRVSGLRFGYSQIANPIFLVRKGTMTRQRALTLMSRNIASNVAKTLLFNRIKDFPGRLRGNLQAFSHLLSGKLDPEHISRM